MTFEPHPIIREECKESPKCVPLVKHFEHCQEKVLGGKGFKGEDCVEELYVASLSLLIRGPNVLCNLQV